MFDEYGYDENGYLIDRYLVDAYFERRKPRRERRYFRLAYQKLPEWAPKALVAELSGALMGISCVRRTNNLRSTDSNSVWLRGCKCSACIHCNLFSQIPHERAGLDRVELLIRLATYSVEMKSAWKAVVSWGAAKGIPDDVLCEQLIQEISGSFRTFDAIPKRSATERKKGARKVARLADELAKAIEQDVDAKRLGAKCIAEYIGARHHDFLEAKGGTDPARNVPPIFSYAPDPIALVPEGMDDDELATTHWDSWEAINQYQWLYEEIGRTEISKVLSAFADDLEKIGDKNPEISRPGSGDPMRRYLVARLSKFMSKWFDSPRDDTVACFVSAALNLETPLPREDVQSTRKRAKET